MSRIYTCDTLISCEKRTATLLFNFSCLTLLFFAFLYFFSLRFFSALSKHFSAVERYAFKD